MKKLLGWSLFAAILAVSFCFPEYIHSGNETYSILLGVVGAGVGIQTSFTQQYLPQFIWFTSPSSPDINIKVSGEGTIWDIVGLGVNEFATIRQFSRTANYYLLQLGSGLLKEKTVTFSITNQNAAAFNLYGFSRFSPTRDDFRYCVCVSQVCLAASGTDFSKFGYLSLPSAGATDRYNVEYNDGTNQQYDSRDEFKASLQSYQNSISAVGYNIDNVSAEIARVQVIPTAQQTAFVMKYAKVGEVNSTLISRS